MSHLPKGGAENSFHTLNFFLKMAFLGNYGMAVKLLPFLLTWQMLYDIIIYMVNHACKA